MSNNIYNIIDQEETKIYNKKIIRTQIPNKSRNKKISKSQSTIDTTQAISKRILQKKNGNNTLGDFSQNTILTFIGHGSDDDINAQEKEENNDTKEFEIAKKYQQNVLKKFNKRKNVILFVDNFEESEENKKYIYQINSIISDSKSPIIILTNNINLLSDPISFGNYSFGNKYIPYQIENEGISQKENIIYMTFIIIYFIVFFPETEIEKNKINNNLNELNDVIHITDNDNEENIYYDYNLEKIRKAINSVFIDTKLKKNDKDIYSSLITFSNIIAIINSYELDNILVYLKNLFQFINNPVKQNALRKITLIKNKILEEIEEYQINDDINIDNENEDLYKLSDEYEINSFLDYERGMLYNIGEKQCQSKVELFTINSESDYNKESYFYINEFCTNIKNKKIFNYISNNEINERIFEDHKFFQNYYNGNIILNHSDIIKINMILTQIILNEHISLEDVSKLVVTRFSKRKNYRSQINAFDDFQKVGKEKITMLNKLFRKCNSDIFIKYINAHLGFKYYVKFDIDNKKYYIPDKLVFYNYFNDYCLLEQIQAEQNMYNMDKDGDEDEESNLIDDEDEEEEEMDYY